MTEVNGSLRPQGASVPTERDVTFSAQAWEAFDDWRAELENDVGFQDLGGIPAERLARIYHDAATVADATKAVRAYLRCNSFTLVFDGDLSAFKGNPFHVDTPFGKARACGLGDLLAREQEAADAADTLASALLDMMRAMPPNGRTREQMAAMVAAGKAISVWRDL